MITEGATKVIGGGNSYLMYLVHKYPLIMKELYDMEQEAEITPILNWFLAKMRPCTARLIHMCIRPKLFNQEPPTTRDLNERKDEFFIMLKTLEDEKLKNRTYLSGHRMTIVDVQIYCEIKTILVLYATTLPSKL